VLHAERIQVLLPRLHLRRGPRTAIDMVVEPDAPFVEPSRRAFVAPSG
jgi:hypothetical protein